MFLRWESTFEAQGRYAMNYTWISFTGLAHGTASVKLAKVCANGLRSVVCTSHEIFHFCSAQCLSVFEF